MSEEKKKEPVMERASILTNLVQPVPTDDEGAKLYPIIFDLLYPRYKDGKQTRLAGSITLKVDGSMFRVTVSCPSEKLQTTWTTDTMKDLFKRLEAFLASGKAGWSPTYEAVKDAKKALDKMPKSE